MQNPSDSEIKEILGSANNIAIVGLSDSPDKPSYGVARYLISSGYNIYPVNPKYDSILGVKCYQSLNDINENIDIVDVFRRPEHILPVAEKAIEIKARVLWMQLGIINKDAAHLARNAGLDVIMDRCIKIEHRRLFL
jgi:predicted CoA-binding protein